MNAEEARILTRNHSKRMQDIYSHIEKSAKQGNSEIHLFTSQASASELEVLRKNGFHASYETSETDGGQFVIVKW